MHSAKLCSRRSASYTATQRRAFIKAHVNPLCKVASHELVETRLEHCEENRAETDGTAESVIRSRELYRGAQQQHIGVQAEHPRQTANHAADEHGRGEWGVAVWPDACQKEREGQRMEVGEHAGHAVGAPFLGRVAVLTLVQPRIALVFPNVKPAQDCTAGESDMSSN
ncbi:O-antigen polymerase [Babesia caballi]|uniref:O-antigen polymerase n=1 Tax=Babesia caballi TaxID=5871 RepID=A0AAV4LVF7_BABCB|nr:O-antigen polymerase [Babesia caballi]